MRCLRGGSHSVGDILHRRLAVTIGGVNECLHGHEVDDPAELLFLADRQMYGDDPAPERFAHGIQ